MQTIDFAIVHHANQYIITDGYRNREGLSDVLGMRGARNGYLEILELHKAYGIPFNIHLSGTLLESILWQWPGFLSHVRDLRKEGILDVVGGSYGQDIMRFFGYEHNFRQLNEGLRLYSELLEISPRSVKIFWPPERLWDTERLAAVLTDPRLSNGGYEYVLVDDRLFYPATNGTPSRKDLDRSRERSPLDFCPCRIVGGKGLTALPISSPLRRRLPPRSESAIEELESLFSRLAESNSKAECALIALYGDDLEKSAGCCGWDERGPEQYETFLKWLSNNTWVRPVKLSRWVTARRDVCQKSLEVGSYFEMSNRFGAGEDYEKWYRDPRWDKYRNYYAWAEGRVLDANGKGSDAALLETAWKHLLASAWETAWHTPSYGTHSGPGHDEPSPWIKAIASHSRHAAIIAEAAYWMKNKNAKAYAYLADIDNDGDEELILKNDMIFAVVSPRYGGRLVYFFDVGGTGGRMVIGNPSDDWNWQEELNKYMQTPANHPGALSDIGHENDRYKPTVNESNGDKAEALLVNRRRRSPAYGLRKIFRLSKAKNEIEVAYELPDTLMNLSIECGFSPDYFHLLRAGQGPVKEHKTFDSLGYSNNGTLVWLRLADSGSASFDAYATTRTFGHGYAIRVRALSSTFTVFIGAKQE